MTETRPRLCSGNDAATAYRTVQRRVDALLRGRTDVAERTVPACPQWSVRQTLGHLVGIAQDIVSLNLEGVGTDAWTRAQLDRVADHSLDELLDLWAGSVDAVVDLLMKGPKLLSAQGVFDSLTHEHDIRGALDESGSRTRDPVFGVAAGFLTTMLDRGIRRAALPSLRLTTRRPEPSSSAIRPKHPARIAVELSDFEALRTFGGRRSRRQLLALPWQGDGEALLPVFQTAVVRPPTDDLVE